MKNAAPRKLDGKFKNFTPELFSALDAAKIDWLVLRGYADLPETVSRDVDLLVSADHMDKFRTQIALAAKKTGLKIALTEQRFGYDKIILWDSDWPEEPMFQVDAFCPENHKGICWFSDDLVLSARQRYNYFWIPKKGHEAANILIKGIYAPAPMKPRYRPHVAALIADDRTGFLQIADKVFSANIINEILELVKNNDWERLDSTRKKFEYDMIKKAWKNSPFSQARLGFKFIKEHINNLFNPAGTFIALVGPDGSGKTTISNELTKLLSPEMFPESDYYHGLFKKLPELKVFYGFFKKMVGKEYKPVFRHSGPDENGELFQYSPLRGSVYVAYYSFDYLMGHWDISKKKYKNHLIIADRYYYDYYAQSLFDNTPFWLKKLGEKLIPKPEMMILLKNNPETVYGRKAELTVEEINRQLKFWEEFIAPMDNSITVSTDKTPKEIAQEIAEALFKQRSSQKGNKS